MNIRRSMRNFGPRGGSQIHITGNIFDEEEEEN